MHLECFSQDARRGFGQSIVYELIFRRERHIGYVAPGFRFAIDPFAQIIDDDVMKSRPLFLRRRARWSLRLTTGGTSFVLINAIENLDHLDDAHRKPSLLLQFAYDTLLKRFPQLQRSARDRPLPAQRLAAATYQQRPAG